jgi:hypothetical protein
MVRSRPSRTSELDFVIAASGVACTAARSDSLTDWAKVLELALHHRVLARVYRNAASVIPQAFKQHMHDHVLRNSRNAMSNLLRTIEAVQLLERAKIRVIVLKGPLLAHRLYGDYGLRICGDVDLLVRADDLLRAAQALSAAGYHHHTKLDARSLTLHRKLEHDVAFAHPSDDTLVELHGDIAQPHYSYRVNLEQWWAARQSVQVAGIEISVLRAEHAYLLCALHGAKHQWNRLDLIADLAAFRHVALNRDRINVEAEAAGLTRVVEIGEGLASHFYADAPCPDDALVTDLMIQLVGGESLGRWEVAWVDVRSRERVQDQIRYLAGRFVRKPLLDLGRLPFLH